MPKEYFPVVVGRPEPVGQVGRDRAAEQRPGRPDGGFDFRRRRERGHGRHRGGQFGGAAGNRPPGCGDGRRRSDLL